MYADDKTLDCNLSNNAYENYLNSELNKISEWLASNKLSLSARKTKFMVFHTVQRKIQYPILTINNTVIERESKAIQFFRHNITLYAKMAETC